MNLERELRQGRPADLGRAVERLTTVADRAGLVDVAVTTHDSPLGPLLLAATERGLVRLAYPEEGVEEVLAELAGRLSPRLLEHRARLEPALRQLDEYFSGRARRFELDIDWSLAEGFGRRVLEATARIPFGEVATYGAVAARAGNPRAARAAGNALGANPIPVIVPCHRVVRAGGSLGGYTGGIRRKEYLLGLEGALPS